MHVYRPLGRIEAITFDLDDTLYDNGEVVRRSSREALRFLRDLHPGLSTLTEAEFGALRDELRAQEPEIYHDMTEWRRRTVALALRRQGMSEAEADDGAAQAMTHFAYWRSRISISQETHDTLGALAQRWPLAAITNGNADPHACGLGEYFQFVLRAGPDGRAKPWHDMFHQAAERLNFPLHHLLHVGDDLITDVAGAVRCGMQSCWIAPEGTNLIRYREARLLPHIAIARLVSLTALL
ncbi:flavin mononucleotide phosphatase [Lonsdalea iberica]|uniref:Flavin mononucleotide phosphatase n=1 Tax=Lonsdalea iberica TaxID=1082703 RepID=A0A1X3RRG7_9GAMM|nr:5-amino-6-(5-phospho-D-ribitylamino)uracil phosphatase YigB [Lonsdalea iberica]OSN04401.1 flavin mononucleotide phosphatase [Lonsdalea iberica]OSN08944.1 flavin mononucleotide phosphatase [Lonsdalea iberica]